MKSIILFLFCITTHSLFGQSGPASVGTSANNTLWLKANAGTSTVTDGAAISTWADQSGNSNNAVQGTGALQPLYRASVINGMPAIQFDNVAGANADVLVVPDNNNLDNTTGLTIFAVTQPNTLDGNARSIVSKRVNVGSQESYMLFFLTANKINVDIDGNGDRFASTAAVAINTNYLIGLVYNGASAMASRASLYVNETLDGGAARSETSAAIPNYLSDLTIGLTNVADGRPYGGHIAELILYTKALNVAERIIVSNYLSAKYNISILAASDLYAGDTPGNGDFDFEVAGVGTDASGSNLSSSSAITGGLAITQVSGFQNNDYLIFGHQAGQNVASSDVGGMTGTNNSRWNRVWYCDITNAGANENIDMTFDMSDGGNTIVPSVASNYVLLYRAGLSGNWTELVAASSIAGDRITFAGVTVTADGYFTIGTRDQINSPLPIQLVDFTARPTEKGIELSWRTETELNNNYFTVERSMDGVNFETIMDVPGGGTSTRSLTYQATDRSPYPGRSYYRLKQTDFDGADTFSGIIGVYTESAKPIFIVFPNPATQTINLRVEGDTRNVILKIVDSNGRAVAFSYSCTDSLLSINSSSFQKGLYVIHAINGTTTWSQRVVIE